MISVQEASAIILQQRIDWGTEKRPLEAATGFMLAEDIRADRDFPPFTRVSMDGIAISFDDFEKGFRSFRIAGIQAAGSPQRTMPVEEGYCLEVMTGAIQPLNSDTVIRYEDVHIEDGMATIQIADIRRGQNAHPRGSDRQAGDLLVPKGRLLSAAEIGIAATVGKKMLQVYQQPRIVIIATGDELVEVDEQPLPHQIRQSNAYTLQAAMRQQQISADRAHLTDEAEAIRKNLKKLLEEYDVLILNGGVSKGKFDLLPQVLEEFEVKKLFHHVKQRPGKPFWFGKSPAGKLVFAFPGNPVSAFMCLHRYFFPWYRANLGLNPWAELLYASLSEPVKAKPNRTTFLQVKLELREDGLLTAQSIAGRGSGDLANLVDADGFMELPTGQETFEKGEAFPVYLYRTKIHQHG